MSHKPDHFDKALGRLEKAAGITQYERGMTMGQPTPRPTPSIKRDPKVWEKYKTPQGFMKWRKRKTGPQALPLDKSVKKGSPRSYENLKKAKPLGKKRKNGIG